MSVFRDIKWHYPTSFCSVHAKADVDLELILFLSLEPVAGAVEELATEIGLRDAVDTKQAVCVSVIV